MKAIKTWWNKRRRNVDLQILWPECKRQAPTLDEAKAVFAYHAFNDPAWMVLGHTEVYRIIDGLE